MLIIATDIHPERVYTFEARQDLPDIPAAETTAEVLIMALRSGDFAQAARTIIGSLRQHPQVDTVEPTCLVVNITPAGVGFMPFMIHATTAAATADQKVPPTPPVLH